MRRQTVPLVLLMLACIAAAASAQQPLASPSGWKWVTDAPVAWSGSLDPPETSFLFGTMAPGWHITSRPAARLFEPTVTLSGRFVVESESFLFPGTSPEGFGVFVGGRDLDAAGASSVAFLIRRDGSAAVERREGRRVTLLVPWTRHAAVVAHTGDEKSTARNLVRVEAEAATVTLLVNGTKVLDVPRTPGAFDGIVGLQVGADLNLHVTNLDVTRRLALPRNGQ